MILLYGGSAFAQNRNLHPMSIPLDSTSECTRLHKQVDYLYQAQNFLPLYDTARHCIEMCANQPNIWRDFQGATFGCQYLSTDLHRYPVYQAWLKKVLYLNMDTNFYCADAYSILSTFTYFNDKRGYDQNGALAVLKFLLDSHRCLSWFQNPNPGQLWSKARYDQLKFWQDTVKNPTLTPLDTTLPSLEDLDLQILRGPQYAAVKNGFTPSSLTKIEYLIASQNPFNKETTLHFGLHDAEYMKIEVYDLLGNKIFSDSRLCSEGEAEWRIDGQTLPRGSLYVRLSIMGGEVKTVKLIHE